MDSSKMTTEVEGLKKRLRATWMAGDFAEIAKAIHNGEEEFVSRLDLAPGKSVLDVACGNGSTAIPAALAGAEVIGIDIAPYLIEQAIDRAAEAGVKAEFDVGDVEDLPYEDSSFDIVISVFGAMFAPRPDMAAYELARVCRPGGTIAMANWTPQGFIGQMFRMTGKHVAPPAGMPSPILWGDGETVTSRFEAFSDDIRMTRRDIDFALPLGPAEVVEHFRRFYGPTQKAFEALDAAGQDALRKDLEDLWSEHNSATDGTTRVASEYLEVKVIRI
jgi:SAM-dependent methyltransferase